MSYTNTYSTTRPDGATTAASDIDREIRWAVGLFAERLTEQFGFDFTTDPIVLSKIANALQVDTKQVSQTEYDAGNSGTAITLNFTTNGNTQKVTISGTPAVITLAGLKSGGRYIVRISNASARTFSFANTNTKFTGATRSFTSDNCIFSFYSDGTTAYGFYGLAFSA